MEAVINVAAHGAHTSACRMKAPHRLKPLVLLNVRIFTSTLNDASFSPAGPPSLFANCLISNLWGFKLVYRKQCLRLRLALREHPVRYRTR